MFNSVCEHFDLVRTSNVLFLFFQAYVARDKHSVYLQSHIFKAIFDPWRQSVRNYKNDYYEVVYIRSGRPFWLNLERNEFFPLYWLKKTKMECPNTEWSVLEDGEKRSILYFLSITHMPNGKDLIAFMNSDDEGWLGKSTPHFSFAFLIPLLYVDPKNFTSNVGSNFVVQCRILCYALFDPYYVYCRILFFFWIILLGKFWINFVLSTSDPFFLLSNPLRCTHIF